LGKKSEIEGILEVEKGIQHRLNELINGNKYEEMLTKIFKKKIKRSKVYIYLIICNIRILKEIYR